MMRHAKILILALFALTACGRKGKRSSDFDRATAAALATRAPGAPVANQPKVARVTGVELGHQLDRHNMVVGGSTDQFAPGDSILISARTQYAAADLDVSARLRQNNHTIDSTGAKAGPADSAGMGATSLRFGQMKGVTKGTYQADVFLNGKFQMSTEFTIIK